MQFTDKELNHLRNQDMLFAASRWAQGVIESNRVFNRREQAHVVPLGVDRALFHESAEAAAANGQPRPTVFLSIGKWEKRKGHDVLLDTFCRAFQPDDQVELWMLCYNTVIASDSDEAAAKNRAWEERYRSSPLGEKIKILPRCPSQREVAEIMRRADCGVFLSRAEGWNLPALEMLSCGRRIIITNYSAHTEYCDRSNALLVEIDKLEDAYDDRWFFGQGQWAALGDRQIEQAIAHMRQVHAAKQQTGHLAVNQAGIETAKRLSWDHAVTRMFNVLS